MCWSRGSRVGLTAAAHTHQLHRLPACCSSIKVATKRADEPYVHELCLAAADLEQRYQNHEVGRQSGWSARIAL